MYRRLPPAQSLIQAIDSAPSLARLAGLAEQSSAMYRSVEGLIPPKLRPHIKPGAVQAQDWCLVVSHGASAAKLRQLLPRLCTHLQQSGWDIQTVRIKILGSR
jgi:hypothetical protein